jgi:multidrug transporter EmrE-like cation transporter
MNTFLNAISLFVFTCMLAVGQLLFKHVGLAIRGQSLTESLYAMARQPAFYGALALYGVSTLLWVWILSRVPLTQAYPWVAAGVAIVPLLGWLTFGERVTPMFWFGVAFIIAGILLTQFALAANQ